MNEMKRKSNDSYYLKRLESYIDSIDCKEDTPMKLYLITLTLSLIALYTFIKRSYKYASVQDEVEDSSNWKGLKKGTLYVDEQGNKISFEIEPPIDYESDKYKESEAWFTGIGRC